MIENQKVVTQARKTSGNRNSKVNDGINKFSKDRLKNSVNATMGYGTSSLPFQQQINPPQQPKPKLKIKRNQKGQQSENRGKDQSMMKDRMFNATANIYRNEYLLNGEEVDGFQPHRNMGSNAKQGPIDMNGTQDILNLDRFQSNAKSPITYEDYEEYHAMGQSKENIHSIQQYEDEYQDIEQDIKIPNFLSRSSIETRDKNQFYMTQIINQPKTNGKNPSMISRPNAQSNSMIIKNSKPQQNNSSKKLTPYQMQRSQLLRSLQKTQQMSPICKITPNHNNILDNYMNFQEATSKFRKRTRDQKRSALNASALVMNAKRVDMLNCTAPLNMTELRMYDQEGLLPETVNCTRNTKKWNDQQHQNFQSYYRGVMDNFPKNVSNSKSKVKEGISPVKSQKKKQLMIKNILKQEAIYQDQNKQYFMNLTLQQLLQQQKLNQPSKGPHIFRGDKRSNKSQKKLNKTLDNYANVYSNINQELDNTNLKTFINNFVQSNKSNYSSSIPKNTSSQLRYSSAQQKNKFSNTMKISDLNLTQIIDLNANSPHKNQKSSLKSTQNLNLRNEDIMNQMIQNDKKGKYSVMSTYSMNKSALPTTSHINQVKRKSETNENKGNQKSDNQQRKSKSKIKGASNDEETIQQMLNLYQTSTKQKNKLTSSQYLRNSQNLNHSYTKNKTNSFLNQYLQYANAVNLNQTTSSKKDRQQFSTNYQTNSKKHVQGSKQIENQCNENINANFQNQLSAIQNVQEKSKKSDLNVNNMSNAQLRMDGISQYRINKYMDIESNVNPYINKKTANQKHYAIDQIKELQNKTQPIPKQLLQMAQAEAMAFSSGTSVTANKLPSRDSNNKKSKNLTQIKLNTRQDQRQNEPQSNLTKEANHVQTRPKIQNPAMIYNNKNTVILDDPSIHKELSDNDSSNYNVNSKLDRFIMGKQIGQGAYAVVRLATMKKDNKKCAIKIYDKSKLNDINRQRSVRREIKLLQKMNHQNIVKIYEAFETDDHVYLVMEFVGGGSLHSYLKEKPNRRLNEEDAKFIFKQILTGLSYCHRKSIAHRDIKLENILLDENKNVKLIDFGFSTCIPNDKKIKMFCGTPSYMAPEIVMKQEYAGSPADIWACGVLLYALMNGCFPFRGATDKELYRRISRGTFTMYNQSASDKLIEFLQRMINVNADLRPSADELLQDPWFQCESTDKKVNEVEDQSISEQKKIFKAKILAKIPVERQNNKICVLSNDKNHIKLNNHNGNLGATQKTQFRNNINLQSEESDYGFHQPNLQRKLNQEAYQAYYNTTCNNYGQSNLQNPYYNNFFNQNNPFIPNQQQYYQPQPCVNIGFYHNTAASVTHQPNKPSYNGNMIINTNPPMFPINFTQHQANQVGTPQVFGSPTGFPCTTGIINNTNCRCEFILISQSNCPHDHANNPVLNNQQVGQDTVINNENNMQFTQEKNHCQNDVGQNDTHQEEMINGMLNCQATQKQNQEQLIEDQKLEERPCIDYDDQIIDSITKMGYHRSHVVSQLENDNSHITKLYAKIKDEKMSMTQQRPLSLQPFSRKPQAQNSLLNTSNFNNPHNKAVFPPNFIPSILDSVKGAGDNDTSGDCSRLCSETNINVTKVFDKKGGNEECSRSSPKISSIITSSQ